MKKLSKLNLSQLSSAELNERELCRLLGGGTPGDCQCGCHGPSGSSSNSSANSAEGYISDSGCGCQEDCSCQSDCSCPPPDSNPYCGRQDNVYGCKS